MASTTRCPRPIYAGRADLLVRSRICLTPSARRKERLGPKLNTPMAAAAFCRHLADRDQEVSVVICLNTKGAVLGVFEAATGGTRSVAAGMQHLLKVPVLMGAHKVVIVHNHPSGDPAPSESDRRFYDRAKTAFELVGPRLVDSLIVADGGFYSLVLGVGGSWSRPTSRLREEVYRQDAQERRSNPPRDLLKSRATDIDRLSEAVVREGVPMRFVMVALTDVIDMVSDQVKIAGEACEACEFSIASLRRAQAGDDDDDERSYRKELWVTLRGGDIGNMSRSAPDGQRALHALAACVRWVLMLDSRNQGGLDKPMEGVSSLATCLDWARRSLEALRYPRNAARDTVVRTFRSALQVNDVRGAAPNRRQVSDEPASARMLAEAIGRLGGAGEGNE